MIFFLDYDTHSVYIGACNNYYVILKNKNYLFFQEYFERIIMYSSVEWYMQRVYTFVRNYISPITKRLKLTSYSKNTT